MAAILTVFEWACEQLQVVPKVTEASANAGPVAGVGQLYERYLNLV